MPSSSSSAAAAAGAPSKSAAGEGPAAPLHHNSTIESPPEPIPCKLAPAVGEGGGAPGRFPSYTAGDLYRLGPGVTDVGDGMHISHWFDGLSMLHRFRIAPDGAAVTYTNRLLAEPLKREIERAGRRPRGMFTFGRDPCFSRFRKFNTWFAELNPFKGAGDVGRYANANVTFGRLRDKHVTKTDANQLVEVDVGAMMEKRAFTYTELSSKLRGALSAAHSQTDSETGEFFNFVTDLSYPKSTYTVFSVPPQEAQEPVVLAKFDAPATYLHSFALTKKYLVMVLHPARIRPMAALWHRNVEEAMSYRAEEPTVFYVISRAERRVVRRYTAPAMFTFHNVNAYDSGGDVDDIVIDLVNYDSMEFVHLVHMDKLRRKLEDWKPFERSKLVRYTLRGVNAPPSSAGATRAAAGEAAKAAGGAAATAADGVAECRPLEPADTTRTIELPRFNGAAYHMRPHRYVYGIGGPSDGSAGYFADAVVKVDVETGTRIEYTGSGGAGGQKQPMFPSEPIFVPRPGATAEDDGVLLTVVFEPHRGCSSLVALDARELREVARADTPHVVTAGFHGNWYGAASA